MPSIDGFDYETWEYSSCIARRNYRHDNGGGPESLPHRSKSKGKPRKKDVCPENDGKHLYVKVKSVTLFTTGRSLEWVYNTCIGCGKRGKRVRYYQESDIYQTYVSKMVCRKLTY